MHVLCSFNFHDFLVNFNSLPNLIFTNFFKVKMVTLLVFNIQNLETAKSNWFTVFTGEAEKKMLISTKRMMLT